MAASFQTYLAICSALTALAAVAAEDEFIKWGPSVTFKNGEYWGQSAVDVTTGYQVPHGTGTYISKQGHLLYAGKWWKGYMHGRGNRFYADGRNYSGFFEHNTIHGEGTLTFPNGTILRGAFKHGIPDGVAEMNFPNGDSRRGYLSDGTFIGPATYTEAATGTVWTENWHNGSYPTKVYIYKKVLNRYNNSLSVEIICKVHAQNARAELLREGVLLDAEMSPPAFEGHEVQTLTSKLPFSDDSFKVYSCRAVLNNGRVVAEDKLQVRNPFFLESHGECGVQFARPKNELRRRKRSYEEKNWRQKRSHEARVIMGREISYHGEVPWQALLSSNLTIKTIEDGKVKIQAKRFNVHRDFNPDTFFNDLALISLKTKIQINAFVNPICLPRDTLKISNDDFLAASGFGLTFNTSDPYRGWHRPSHLMVTHLKLLPMSDCFPVRNEKALKFEGHLCAGSAQNLDYDDGDQTGGIFAYPDTCRGDSGGPVTLRNRMNGRFYLAGLVSSGARVCGTARGAVYVNVSHYLPWIQRAKLQDLIDDYKETDILPYDKMDSSVFGAIFEYLSKEESLV